MESIIPVTGNATLDHWLAIIGIATTLSSAASSFLNTKVRAAIDSGAEIPVAFLYLALVANYAALNIDKCSQLHKLLRGIPATVLVVKADTDA
jgi:hypothetical protein